MNLFAIENKMKSDYGDTYVKEFSISNLDGLLQLYTRNNRDSKSKHYLELETHAYNLITMLDCQDLVSCALRLSKDIPRLSSATESLNKLQNMYDTNDMDNRKIGNVAIQRCELIRGSPCGLFLVSLMTAVFMYKQDNKKDIKYLTDFPKCVLQLGYSGLKDSISKFEIIFQSEYEIDHRGYTHYDAAKKTLEIEICETKSQLKESLYSKQTLKRMDSTQSEFVPDFVTPVKVHFNKKDYLNQAIKQSVRNLLVYFVGLYLFIDVKDVKLNGRILTLQSEEKKSTIDKETKDCLQILQVPEAIISKMTFSAYQHK
eukprot:NODE_1118_length_2124_cov_0.536296.p1 type:complete len:315 gc:universal NODE_1118_length_2124_cov_0.536296:1420-476(-)